jgi:hypothetical protein
MMQDMMKQCCGEHGMPDFEKMKQFMEQCGKEGFSEDQLAMMKQFCAGKEMPGVEKMKAMMEKCGCMVSESATESKSECCH